jgi:hypothetical protein
MSRPIRLRRLEIDHQRELGQRLQSLLAGLSSAVVWAIHGRVVVIAAAALRGLGNSPRL